jgi:alcohol-forming fatty acyl-CoA reductase
MELNSVQQFFAGKTVFITGATGYMGKVLVEKLLYSCSDVKEIIVLVRAKRGLSSDQRVKKFKDTPVS